eukprot:Mycagemm_TRINITY_DN10243_c0_g1::TRINITY_DN10243_c0_g1_i2::g.3988::m.3988 type:complete len:133 gc:universal TRINITY_DN10243_c0_g1_i2:481-83(-)
MERWFLVHTCFNRPCDGSCETCWMTGQGAACPAPGTLCSNYTDCATCTAQSCGWCPLTETCSQTDTYAPCSGSCTECYKTDSDSCPSSGSCPDFTTASKCSGQSGCVWCTNSNSCQWSTDFGTCTGAACTTA